MTSKNTELMNKDNETSFTSRVTKDLKYQVKKQCLEHNITVEQFFNEALTRHVRVYEKKVVGHVK